MGNMSSNPLSSNFVDFMNGGGCEESFTAVIDYFKLFEEDESENDIARVRQLFIKLDKCIEAHSDYYQPRIQPLLEAKETIKKLTKAEWHAVWSEKFRDYDLKIFDVHEYMKRGPCGESVMAFLDCMEKNNEERDKCVETNSKLCKCISSHTDYYPKFPLEATKERFLKATKDLFK